MKPQGPDLAAPVEVVRSARARQVARLLGRDPAFLVGVTIILIVVTLSILAPLLTPYDPIKPAPRNKLLPVGNEAHLLGTDQVGRDIFARFLYGSRPSMAAGLAAAAISMVIGVGLGLLAGFYGGWVDAVITRLTDFIMSFPFILLGIIVVMVLGPGLFNVTLAIAILGTPFYIRIIRAEVMAMKVKEYVVAAQSLGAGAARLLRKHLFPNIVSSIVVTVFLHIGFLILQASALSFIGLGAQPPSPEWGAMLADGRGYVLIAPHVVLVPGIAISVLVLSFNLVGNGLRDALDPLLSQARTDLGRHPSLRKQTKG